MQYLFLKLMTCMADNKQWGPWRSPWDGSRCIRNSFPWKMEGDWCCY